jgi:hypothetical protein
MLTPLRATDNKTGFNGSLFASQMQSWIIFYAQIIAKPDKSGQLTSLYAALRLWGGAEDTIG